MSETKLTYERSVEILKDAIPRCEEITQTFRASLSKINIRGNALHTATFAQILQYISDINDVLSAYPEPLIWDNKEYQNIFYLKLSYDTLQQLEIKTFRILQNSIYSFIDLSLLYFPEDIDLVNYKLPSINFHGSIFEKKAIFQKTIFMGWAYFAEVVFMEKAMFSNVTFLGQTSFLKALFSKRADFSGATFLEWTVFEQATFSELTIFSGATFTVSSPAEFSNAKFIGEAIFQKTNFIGTVKFIDTKFSKIAYFQEATFTGGIIDFSKSHFEDKSIFSGSTFIGFANFSRITFEEQTEFSRSTFQVIDFNNTKFLNTTDFSYCLFDTPPKFHGAKLHRDTSFFEAKVGVYEKMNLTIVPSIGKSHKQILPFSHDSFKKVDNDIRAYRTLKEIMANNKAYQDEYRFHSLELIAQSKLDIIKFLTDPISRSFNIAYSIIYLFISHTGQSTWMPLAWWITILVTWGSIFAGHDIAIINPSLLENASNIWGNNQYLGYWYSLQSISNPFSLFSTDVPFYPKNDWAAFLAHTESILGVIIITLWIFALKRRFQKGE